jgi:hypothetical protein
MKIKRKDHSSEEVKSKKDVNKEEDNLPGYPVYPPEEDIFQADEEADLNPEDLSERKNVFKFTESQEIRDIETGDDLDIPGSELDDEQELTGNEDEENNYFSLGGDDHENLEEDDIDKENRMD